MKSFKFGNAQVIIHRSATFFHGWDQTTEALITIRGDVQQFYLKNEIIDLVAAALNQQLFKNGPRNRKVFTHEPINNNKAYELKWTIRSQGNYMSGGQAL